MLKLIVCLVVAIPHVIGQQAYSNCSLPCMYLTTLHSIIQAPLHAKDDEFEVLKSQANTFVRNSKSHLRALEIDEINNDVYWSDLFLHDIYTKKIASSANVSLLFGKYGIGYAQSLAVDWSSNVLYWTDSLTNDIKVATTSCLYVKVLIKFAIDDKPRGIVVHSFKGYLFWSDWGDNARIESSTLSGNNRVTLASDNVVWPNDITIDYETEILYWIDAFTDILESVRFNGNDRIPIKKLSYPDGGRVHPYSLYFYGNKIFYTDWAKDSVFVTDVKPGSTKSPTPVFILADGTDGEKNIGQVRILSNISQNAMTPCLSIKNKCSHLCLKSSNVSFVCDCPTGMILSADNVTCRKAEKDFEIFYADSGTTSLNHLEFYVKQNGSVMKSINTPESNDSIQEPSGLDYDRTTGKIFWTDLKNKKTYSINENGTDLQVLLKQEIGASIALTIDETSRIMYLFDKTSTGGYSLVAHTLDGQFSKTIFKNLRSPQDIAVFENYIFISDPGQYSIIRINNDGSGKLTHVNTDRFRLKATGLDVDIIERRLYWCEKDMHVIKSSDLNFKNLKVIVQKTYFYENRFYLVKDYGNVLNPFDISVHHEKVFWTDLKLRAILSADKRNGDSNEYVTGGLEKPKEVHVKILKPSTDVRKVYRLSYTTNYMEQFILCYKTACPSPSTIREPDGCPTGYKETNYGSTCANCSDPVGTSFKCRCKDWMTCAQRGYSKLKGCHPGRPFQLFKVRECTQVVNKGVCPYRLASVCADGMLCSSDNDCQLTEKCCVSKCGKKCVKALPDTDHPCKLDNGGCSHFCAASPNAYKCLCPDDMEIIADGKTCQNISAGPNTDVCSMPIAHGPCHPIIDSMKWYFDTEKKSCETFLYGGCGGNENRYESKEVCQAYCSGECPTEKQDSVGLCSLNNSSCSNNTMCPGKQLCCGNSCGSTCKNPVINPYQNCFLKPMTGPCKSRVRMYHFDHSSATCKPFTYGGCQGNLNKFASRVSCINICSKSICFLPKVSGPCESHVDSWFYNSSSMKCEQFVYGGCSGNHNNFPTKDSCADRCVTISIVSSSSLQSFTTTLFVKPTPAINQPNKTTSTKVLHTLPNNTTNKINHSSIKETLNLTKFHLTTTKTTKTTTMVLSSTSTMLHKSTTLKLKVPLVSDSQGFPFVTSYTFNTQSKLHSSIDATRTLTANTVAVAFTSKFDKLTTTSKATHQYLTTSIHPTSSEKFVRPTILSTVNMSAPQDICRNSTCLNSGVCLIVDNVTNCKCVVPWIGDYCKFNSDGHDVMMEFSKKNSTPIEKKKVQKFLSDKYSEYCRIEMCMFEGQGRLRRDTSIFYYHVDVYIQTFEDDDDTLKISYSGLSNKDGVMSRRTIQSGMIDFLRSFESEFGLTHKNTTTSTLSKQRKGLNPVAATFISLFVIASVLAVVILIWFIKKKRGKFANSSGVHWSFENQLYEDVYPQDVPLPTETVPDSTTFTNPMYANKPIDVELRAEYDLSPLNDEKKQPEEWVEFPENEHVKNPITDFVEANFNDPYDIDAILNQSPPAYSSRSHTPAQERTKNFGPGVSVTSLSDIRDNGGTGLGEIEGVEMMMSNSSFDSILTPRTISVIETAAVIEEEEKKAIEESSIA